MINEHIVHKVIRWIRSHPWLKLIALILAVMVWFYIRDEINRFNY
jgi:hypothetical protein